MSADFGATQRVIANRALTKILLMGLGSSTLLHTVAIAGMSYWAHNHPDEQMEIVEVDRVEVAPARSPTPSTKLIPKVVKPPIPASVPMPIPIKISTPKAILTPVTVVKVTKSVAIKSSKPPFTNSRLPVARRFAPPAKIVSINSPKSNPNPSFPDRLFSDPLPKNISKLAQVTDRSIPNDSQPKLPPELGSNLGENLPKRSEIDANIINKSSGDSPNRDRDIMAEVPINNTQIAHNHGGDNGVKLGNQTNLGGSTQQNSSIDSGLNGNDLNNSRVSNKPSAGTPENIATGSRNRVSIQCLRNCEIRYPDELENSDIGKDKILVKVTIDPNGLVTNAEIDRSSGNQKLDQVTLAGVKQMQLTATGQTRIYRIRISTLLR